MDKEDIYFIVGVLMWLVDKILVYRAKKKTDRH